MILVTGAAGKTGKAILRQFTRYGVAVRAMVFRTEQIEQLEALGAKEILVGDMRDSDFVHKAVQGVDSVYHICPNVHPDEISIGRVIIEAAVESSITHFVYHSVLHPQVESMPHHWKKMRVEEFLIESGVPFTILQPAAYMQNVFVNWESIVVNGIFTVPYSVESRLSMVDLEDAAEVAAIVLMDTMSNRNHPRHVGATYELVGAPAMAQTEVAAILSRHMNRTVTAECVPIDAWEARALTAGMGEYQVNTLGKMFKYYREYGFWGNSQVLGWLLNRTPTSFDDFVRREIAERLHVLQ